MTDDRACNRPLVAILGRLRQEAAAFSIHHLSVPVVPAKLLKAVGGTGQEGTKFCLILFLFTEQEEIQGFTITIFILKKQIIQNVLFKKTVFLGTYIHVD